LTGVQAAVLSGRPPQRLLFSASDAGPFLAFGGQDIAVAGVGVAPAQVGSPRLTFMVDAVDDFLDRLRAHGAELVGEVAQYEDYCRYCYVRGPEGVNVGLVEDLG
jgi:predicted enzyme related to lactoylglutathione lyase